MARGGRHANTLAEARAALRARLDARRPEIEQATLARVYAISDPTDADPAYREGLRAAVSTAIDYALEATERGEENAPPLPPSLLAQARLAARGGVGLDAVLRRYLAGYALHGEFIIAESEEGGLIAGAGLRRLLRGHAALFDRLLSAVAEEYRRELAGRLGSREERRAERAERLLAGEALDTSEFDYDFDGWHVGALASGTNVGELVRELPRSLDCRLLLIHRGDDRVWAWLGSRHRLDPAELLRIVRGHPPPLAIAFGEPARGLSGWRLSHRQAVAALSIALRGPQSTVRYADVALVASILQDDVLAASLRHLYIEPLAAMPGGGRDFRETLRAYVATGGNVSSSAAALGIDRRTVTRRIRTIEEILGRSLTASAPEVEAALRIWDLDAP